MQGGVWVPRRDAARVVDPGRALPARPHRAPRRRALRAVRRQARRLRRLRLLRQSVEPRDR